MKSDQYFVYVFGHAPKVIQDDFETAHDELKRVMLQPSNFGKKGYILKIVKGYENVVTLEEIR
jgi:hypothetical protein